MIQQGLVFGLMPYPEAIYARWLHPTHTRDRPRTRPNRLMVGKAKAFSCSEMPSNT